MNKQIKKSNTVSNKIYELKGLNWIEKIIMLKNN